MITLNDKKYLNKIRSLRDHGMDYSNDIQNSKPSFMKDHQNAGYNFRMTDIQASLGISQMNRSDKILRERQDIAFRYDEAFASNEGIGNPVVKEENFIHGYQSYACIYKPNDVKKALESKDYDSLINISQKEINLWIVSLMLVLEQDRPLMPYIPFHTTLTNTKHAPKIILQHGLQIYADLAYQYFRLN